MMERYESLGLVGEGSYGAVLKCRHRDSGRLVAIKKFLDSDDDKTVKKIALREIKLLRRLRHGNLVNLLEVWKRRRHWYLVFEFVERTLLEDLEQNPSGLDLNTSRQYLYQILRAAAFCHQQNIIHRDIKPENILISQGGVVKLCDFGFARTVASPAEGVVYTDYVATRWYRAPELLVGDIKYGKPVDVWAVGCLLLEMLTGQPLFPGDSDLDQIYHIVRCFGNLTAHHRELFHRNPVFSGVRLPECSGRVPLQQRFPTVPSSALHLAEKCLQMDPERRAQCSELVEDPLFTLDSFHIRFSKELNAKIQKDLRGKSTLPQITKSSRKEVTEKNQRAKDKKQPEGTDDEVNREEKDKKETKAKEPPKLFKTARNTSEHLTSTRPTKTEAAQLTDAPVAMKGKAGKAPAAESFKSAKTDYPDWSEGLRNENTLAAKHKRGNVPSPELKEDRLKRTNTEGLPSSVPSSTEKICRSTQNQENGKNRNDAKMKASKVSHSTTNQSDVSSPTNVSLESKIGRTDSAPQAWPPSDDRTTPTIPSGTEPSKVTPLPIKLPKGLHKERELTEGSIKRRTFKNSSKVIKEDHLKIRPTTKTASLQEDPESSEQTASKPETSPESRPESRPPSVSMLSESTTAAGSSIPQTLKVSDKENGRDLALPVSVRSSVNQSSKVLGSSSSKQKNNSSEVGSEEKSPKPSHLNSSFQQSGRKSESFRNCSSVDLDEFDLSAVRSSAPPPPPPPPPPSSTPLLTPSLKTGRPTAEGDGFLPETCSSRCVDKSRRHGGVYSRPSQQSEVFKAPTTAQASDKNLMSERSFLSDRRSFADSGGAAAKKKSGVHFPDLRSSVLPELRKAGKHDRAVTEERRKHKQLGHNNNRRTPKHTS